MYVPFDLRWWLLTHLSGVKQLPTFYVLGVLACFTVFMLLVFAPHLKSRLWSSDYLFVAAMAAFIVSARWSGLLPGQLNVDESQFLAGAAKLMYDPVFWRSVDGATSGPLNFYALTFPAYFGFKLEYASARLVAIILSCLSVHCLYLALSALYGRVTARLAILPLATTFALLTFWQYVHYTSSYVSVALLSAALLLVCRQFTEPVRPWRLLVLGLVLGSVPYAKLQAGPLATVLFLIATHVLWKQASGLVFWRHLGTLVLGGTLATLTIVAISGTFAVTVDFWRSYVQQNIFYMDKGLFGGDLNLQQRLLLVLQLQFTPREGNTDTLALAYVTSAVLLSGLPFLLGLRQHAAYRAKTTVFVVYGLSLLATALFTVAKPPNTFDHYFLFLLVPAGFIIGVFLGEVTQGLRARPGAKVVIVPCVLLTVGLLQVFLFVRRDNGYVNGLQNYKADYLRPDSLAILKHAQPGESMAVWGWCPALHVETGLLQATRESIPVWQIKPSPLQPYFLHRYMADLAKSQPKIFVDSIGQTSYFHNRQLQGYTAFPRLRDYVTKHYHLVTTVNDTQIYIRNTP